MAKKPIVGLTMGDAAGIGPEIILMALRREDVRAAADYAVYGSPEVMARAADVVGWKGVIREANGPADCFRGWDAGCDPLPSCFPVRL